MDGMRGAAVLAVIAYHESLFARRSVIGRVLPVGALGVDVFFAISGFLITALLLQETERRGAISFGAFYLRRARRLLPALAALLVVIGVGAVVVQRGGARDRTLEHVAVAASYTTNWVQALTSHNLAELGHTWTLATEEQFYLVWPLVLTGLLALGLGRQRLVAALGVVAAGTVLWPQFGAARGWPANRFNYGLDTRSAGLALGALLGAAMVYGLLPESAVWRLARRWLAIFGVVVVGVLMHSPTALTSLAGRLGIGATPLLVEEYAVVSAATVFVIWDLVESAPHIGHRILSWRPLVAVGRISYGLYLWDAAIVWGLTPAFTGIGNATGLAAIHVALTFAAATASWFWVERWSRRPRPALAPSGSYAVG